MTDRPVYVRSGYTIVGPKEGDGLYAGTFDTVLKDDLWGEKSYEKAESKMHREAIRGAICLAGLDFDGIDLMLAGDLLNEISASSLAMRYFKVPFVGLYNACSTFSEGMLVGAALIDGGAAKTVTCSTSSHYASAERQYRYPLELGVLRSPVTQWTATGVGATLLTSRKEGVAKITAATTGRVVDFGILDTNNMGAAMAPSACDTICAFFEDTGSDPDDFDALYTGDLGKLGSEILYDLLAQRGIDVCDRHVDCGATLFFDSQKTYQGASGAACSALVFNSYVLSNFRRGKFKRILLAGTGALMSPTTSFQGDSIPAITHLVEVRA